MSAVVEVREPSARFRAELQPPLIRAFDAVTTAQSGITLLRELIVSLAIRGALGTQSAADQSAETLLERIKKERGQIAGKARQNSTSAYDAIDEATMPFQLPPTWKWVRFRDVILDSEAGWSPSCDAGPRSAGSWGVLKVSAVSWGEFRDWENKQLPAHLAPRPQFEVRPGDFLISRANTAELVARSVVVGFPEPRLLLSDKIIRPRLSAHVNSRFFNLVNNAADARSHYAQKASGTSSSMKNVSREVILELPVPIPPLAEQHRIVARVEELMKLCNALEQSGRLADEQHARLTSTLFDALAASESAHALAENWQRVAEHFDLLLDRPEAVDAFEATLLQLAMRGLLATQREADKPVSDLLAAIRKEKDRLKASGQTKRTSSVVPVEEQDQLFGIPPSWKWVRIADVCSLVTDGEHATPQRCDDPTAIPLVTAKNVRSEVMDYSTTDFVSREVAAKCWLRCKPEPGDILMVSVGATLGRLSVLRDPVDMVIVRSVTLLRPVQVGIFVDYLALHLMSLESQREVWSEVKQSAQPGLYLAKTAALRIALPPLAEQHRIVTRVEELRRLCADLRQRLIRARETQSHLADALVEQAAA